MNNFVHKEFEKMLNYTEEYWNKYGKYRNKIDYIERYYLFYDLYL